MKALIICSVHALCDISALERDACNRACVLHGIPAILTAEDHARLVRTATILDVFNHLPGSSSQRAALVDSYLEILNEEIWNVSLSAFRSVFDAVLEPKGHTRITGFVSEYPMLTTNLIRSAALSTNATKLGTITALSDPTVGSRIADSLAANAATLGVRHNKVDVLVAQQRAYDAAASLGMRPRFIEECRPVASKRTSRRKQTPQIPTGAILNHVPISQPVEVSV